MPTIIPSIVAVTFAGQVVYHRHRAPHHPFNLISSDSVAAKCAISNKVRLNARAMSGGVADSFCICARSHGTSSGEVILTQARSTGPRTQTFKDHIRTRWPFCCFKAGESKC